MVQITNYETLGDAVNVPIQQAINNYTLADTVTWVKQNHVMKFGGDLQKLQWNALYTNMTRGRYYFTGSWTTQPYADFLLGIINNTQRLVGTTTNYLNATNYSTYFQDDWKIASRLTLNLGLRYELPNPPHDKYGRWGEFHPRIV